MAVGEAREAGTGLPLRAGDAVLSVCSVKRVVRVWLCASTDPRYVGASPSAYVQDSRLKTQD